MIFWYRNSVLASILSVGGCTMALCGITLINARNWFGVLLLVAGVALAIAGKLVSNKKAKEQAALDQQMYQNRQNQLNQQYGQNPFEPNNTKR